MRIIPEIQELVIDIKTFQEYNQLESIIERGVFAIGFENGYMC